MSPQLKRFQALVLEPVNILPYRLKGIKTAGGTEVVHQLARQEAD